jgi:hypothetical protein
MPEEDVIAQAGGEMQRLWRAAAQVGEFLARRRAQALAAAEQASRAQADAQRAAMEKERRLAEPFYARALDERFWAQATPQDGGETYGFAKRFAPMDPQAALAVRACEREARARWGFDPTVPAGVEQPVGVDEVRAIAPTLPEETLSSQMLDDAVTQARLSHDKEHREATEALDDTHGEETPATRKEEAEDADAAYRWDSLEARKQWEDAMEGQIHDHQAVRAVATADKGISAPVATATARITGARTPVKRSKTAARAARTQTQGL